MTNYILPLTLVVTAFLCLFNLAFAYLFRRRHMREVLSYLAATLFELTIFVVTLLLSMRVIHNIPFRFPHGAPITRTEIVGALAIAIGLFPAAFWHSTSASKIKKRIAHDAAILKEQQSGVHVRNSIPREWIN